MSIIVFLPSERSDDGREQRNGHDLYSLNRFFDRGNRQRRTAISECVGSTRGPECSGGPRPHRPSCRGAGLECDQQRAWILVCWVRPRLEATEFPPDTPRYASGCLLQQYTPDDRHARVV